jgi:hypothetical protein
LADLEGGTLMGPGTLVIANQGTIGATLRNGFVLVNQGTSTGGFINADSTSVFENTGTLIVTDQNSLAINGSGAQFTNSGTIKLGVGSSLQSQANVTISGTVIGAPGSTVNVNNGSLFTLTSTGQVTGVGLTLNTTNAVIAGSIAIPDGGVLSLEGNSFDITGSITGDANATLEVLSSATTFEASSVLQVGALDELSGKLNILNPSTAIGTLTVSGSINFAGAATLGSLNLNGSLSSTGTVTVTGAASIAGFFGGQGKTILQGNTTINGLQVGKGSTLENQGNVTLAASNVVLLGTFVNDAGAVLNNTADTFFTTGSPVGSLINNGSFIKSGGTGGATMFGEVIPSVVFILSPTFVNNGTLEIDSGTVQFAQSFETAGAITIAPTGTLGVSGNFTMDPNAVLTIELSSGGAGLLNVTGVATFAGTLITLPPPNFAPTLGSTIKFASFASQTGAFTSVQEGALAPGEALSFDTTVAGQLNLDVVSA